MVWEPGRGEDVRERVAAVKRWFVNDWQTLDNKIKTSIVEGVSVFLSMFDMPDVAKVFCPGPPEEPDAPQAVDAKAEAQDKTPPDPDKKPDSGEEDKPEPTSIPPVEEERIEGPRHLPPLYELIEGARCWP